MRAPGRTTWVLTWRLSRAGGRNALLASGLAVAAAAVATALLMLTLAADLGFQQRSGRTDWRTPVASGEPVAIQAVGTTFSGGRPVVVVDVAQLPGRSAPAPPGLARFPAPGEVWVSPALASLLHQLPADRRPVRGAVAGILGREALARPGELVAVVGHRPTARAVTAERAADPRRPGDDVTPTRVAAFTGRSLEDRNGRMYTGLGQVVTLLVIMPILVLGGSSARLSVARRDRRLAQLRLLGASPGRIAGLTGAEAALTGAAGAGLGVLGYAVLVPVAARVPVAGGSWYARDLWLGLPLVLAVAAAVVALVVVSALTGLRQVVIGPLGVARRSRPAGASALRAAVFAVAVGAVAWASGKDSPAATLAAFLAIFASLAVIGPLVVRLLGGIVRRVARRPETLLAGRRLLDDPKAAWRTVSGLTLAGFVAGVFAVFGTLDLSSDGRPDQLALAVPRERVAAVQDQARDRLAAAGVRARIGADDGFVALGAGDADRQVTVLVPGGTADLDRARVALTGLVPGQYPVTATDIPWFERMFLTDLARATRVVLGVTFVVAIASAGITAAASVLDRRRTYQQLRLAGTPLRVLTGARRRETMIPVVVLAGGATVTGLTVGSPVALTNQVLDARGMVLLAVCFAIGAAGMLASTGLSGILLRSVTRELEPRPD